MEVNKYLLKKLKEKDSDAFEIIYYEYKDYTPEESRAIADTFA